MPHLHVAPQGVNGPVVLFLTAGPPPSLPLQGELSAADLIPNADVGVIDFGDFVARLLAGDVYVEPGEIPTGIGIVGVGEIELVNGDHVESRLGPGQILYGREALAKTEVPWPARAADKGAIVVHLDSRIALELGVSCSPMLEVFAGE